MKTTKRVHGFASYYNRLTVFENMGQSLHITQTVHKIFANCICHATQIPMGSTHHGALETKFRQNFAYVTRLTCILALKGLADESRRAIHSLRIDMSWRAIAKKAVN